MRNTKASTAKGNLTDRQFRFANGDMYQGEFVDGFFHGWGTIVFSETGDRYDGEFSEDINENGVYVEKWKLLRRKMENNKCTGLEPFQMRRSLCFVNILIENESEKKERRVTKRQATQETNARLNETTQRSIDEVQSSSSMKISRCTRSSAKRISSKKCSLQGRNRYEE